MGHWHPQLCLGPDQAPRSADVILDQPVKVPFYGSFVMGTAGLEPATSRV